MAKSRRDRGTQKNQHDVFIEECQAEVQFNPDTINRALTLLARWTLRRGQKVLEDTGTGSENRVSGCGIKGYGGKNEQN